MNDKPATIKRYAFDLWTEKSLLRYFLYSGITLEATRTAKALKAAERLFPGKLVRVRQMTSQFSK